MAIKRYDDYEKTQAYDGEYETLPLGGHICKVMGTKIETYDWGEVLVVALDIAEGEPTGFYQRQYNRRIETDAAAKWPGTFRQPIPQNNGTEKDTKTKGFFKGMITAIEKSNPGYTWNWDERSLVGKKVGGVFGQEEYRTQDGAVKLSTKCTALRSVDTIRKGVDAPPVRPLKASAQATAPGHSDSDLPFQL